MWLPGPQVQRFGVNTSDTHPAFLTSSPEVQMQVAFGTLRDISTAFCLLPPQETQLTDKMNSLDQ